MKAALEYNDRGCLLWSLDCPGAFARGSTQEEAAARLPADAAAFCRWSGWTAPAGEVEIVEEKYQPELKIEDADSDILLDGERLPLAGEEYAALRALVLRRFLWHDRIHARAMYRRARAVWGNLIPDPFRFDH